MNFTPEQTAAKIGEKITAVDHQFLDMLGIETEPFEPGRAVCHMTITEAMLNSGKFCHGGFIFFLADNAFAYACLSKNQVMMTLSAHVVFTQAAKLGDRLTATARVVTENGPTGSGDVEIVNQDGETVARFQGVAYRRKEPVLRPKKAAV